MESGEDMFETKDTVFASGRILTQEMLNLLYDWPRQTMVQLSCHGLAEGVLCGMEYEAAVARTSAQKPEGFYTSRADIVIKNNSGEDELEKEVSALLEKIGEIIKCQGRKK